jgi:tetratricopeptide (TPR) repeat protein
MLAAGNGLSEMLSLLIKHGADVNATGTGPDGRQFNPLLLAVSCGHEQAVRVLLGNGAWVNVTVQKDGKGSAALDIAVAMEQPQIAALLERYGGLPNDAITWRNRGGALFNAKRFEEALAAYESALAVDPDNADAWVDKGVILRKLGRKEEALAACDCALALNPKHPVAWEFKGLALQDTKRWGEALAATEEALAIDPSRADTWVNKGVIMSNLGRKEEALAATEEALAIDPGQADTWVNKGVILGSLGRKEDALAAYERALSVDPSNQRATRNQDLLRTQPVPVKPSLPSASDTGKIRIQRAPWRQMVEHAVASYPELCCGAMLGQVVDGCKQIVAARKLENIAAVDKRVSWEIRSETLLQIDKEASGQGLELIGIYHSNSDTDAYFSATDLKNSCPWYSYVVLSIKQGRFDHANGWHANFDRSAVNMEDLNCEI